MQEKPPFSSYFDFIFLTYGRGTPPPIPTPAYFDFALRHAPVRADNHSPERGLIGGPTVLSYEFQQVLIQWDWKVLRCCFFLCFSFLFSSFFSQWGSLRFLFCFFFDLVAAVHRASLSPQQQNKC